MSWRMYTAHVFCNNLNRLSARNSPFLPPPFSFSLSHYLSPSLPTISLSSATSWASRRDLHRHHTEGNTEGTGVPALWEEDPQRYQRCVSSRPACRISRTEASYSSTGLKLPCPFSILKQRHYFKQWTCFFPPHQTSLHGRTAECPHFFTTIQNLTAQFKNP